MNRLKWYEDLLASGGLTSDIRQQQVAELLDEFAEQLLDTPNKSFFSRQQKKVPKGVYLYGGVGRGKTLLMDGFYQNLTKLKKRRVHFHSFMRDFHRQMQEYKGTVKSSKQDSLQLIANDIANECEVLCFDEFHISDIADAMILYRLLQELLNNGVTFVMTSNYHPQDLYPNGLARHLFVPAIKLIMDSFVVFALNGEKDYRQLSLSDGEVYFHPNDANSQSKMNAIFDGIACGIILDENLTLQRRELRAIRCSSNAVWFDFATLCKGNRSQADYLELTMRFSYLFLSGMPQLDDLNITDAVRRFTWLVDILYDSKLRLVINADVPFTELYGTNGNTKNTTVMRESQRTLSRLVEMQSSAYLNAESTSQ